MHTKNDKMSVPDKINHLLRVISSSAFLEKQGLGNEVPFFISPFAPSETVKMEQGIDFIKNKIEKDSSCIVLDVNLYDLSIAMLKRENVWDQLLNVELEYSKDQIKELLQGVLDVEKYIIPEIARYMQEKSFDVLFITGIGEVYPYIRSHNILNNLQSTAKEKPTVLFFPGEYSHSLECGASLNLLNCLLDDKYYRAFNIFDYEV